MSVAIPVRHITTTGDVLPVGGVPCRWLAHPPVFSAPAGPLLPAGVEKITRPARRRRGQAQGSSRHAGSNEAPARNSGESAVTSGTSRRGGCFPETAASAVGRASRVTINSGVSSRTRGRLHRK